MGWTGATTRSRFRIVNHADNVVESQDLYCIREHTLHQLREAMLKIMMCMKDQ